MSDTLYLIIVTYFTISGFLTGMVLAIAINEEGSARGLWLFMLTVASLLVVLPVFIYMVVEICYKSLRKIFNWS